MCIASKRLRELRDVLDQIKEDKKKLSEQHSHYDKEISILYHDLEQRVFNAAEGYYIAKDLQTILRKRRLIKNELMRMESLTHSVDLGSLEFKLNNSTKNINKIQKKNKDYIESWNIDGSFVDEIIIH